MALTDPLSLREVRRLSGSADTILLTATRNADLETPIGAFMRFDDGGPAFLLESVEGGERLGRYSFMGVGPRRLLTVRNGLATIQSRPVGVADFSPDLPTETLPVPDPLTALRQFLPKRRILPSDGIPRFPGGAVVLPGPWYGGATLLADLLSRDAADRVIHQKVFTWIPVGQLQVDLGLQIDQLSICFVLLITGVGALSPPEITLPP